MGVFLIDGVRVGVRVDDKQGIFMFRSEDANINWSFRSFFGGHPWWTFDSPRQRPRRLRRRLRRRGLPGRRRLPRRSVVDVWEAVGWVPPSAKDLGYSLSTDWLRGGEGVNWSRIREDIMGRWQLAFPAFNREELERVLSRNILL